jgi:hypothetical protein
MADMHSRRNALVGWLVWTLAKRKLLGARVPEPPPEHTWRRRILRTVTAVAVLALIGFVWARRPRPVSETYTASTPTEPIRPIEPTRDIGGDPPP